MPSNEAYYYAAYGIATAMYLLYAVSLYFRRRAIRGRAERG